MNESISMEDFKKSGLCKTPLKVFADLEVYRSDFALGSALGAALTVHPSTFEEQELHTIYGMERI